MWEGSEGRELVDREERQVSEGEVKSMEVAEE